VTGDEDSDDFELTREWREELDRRVADIDSGKAKPIAHDEVMASVDERLETIRSKRNTKSA
jgi:putative addiction module component (TIGR02574 family)